MRLSGLAAILAPLLACTPSDPQTSATAATTSTTGTPDTGGTTSTPGTTAVTTSGASATDGATTTSTTSPATSGPTTTTTAPATATGTSSTGAGATETGPGTASTGDTGVVPGACGVADGDYGDCALPLGVAFDGVECTPRSGCDCAPDCDAFFPDVASCALTCAGDGRCNPDRLNAAGIAKDPVLEGSFCDGVHVCPADLGIQDIFEAIFGMLTCEPGPFPCDQDPACAGLWQGNLGPDEWLKVCAASLVPMSGPIYCVVYGP